MTMIFKYKKRFFFFFFMDRKVVNLIFLDNVMLTLQAH